MSKRNLSLTTMSILISLVLLSSVCLAQAPTGGSPAAPPNDNATRQYPTSETNPSPSQSPTPATKASKKSSAQAQAPAKTQTPTPATAPAPAPVQPQPPQAQSQPPLPQPSILKQDDPNRSKIVGAYSRAVILQQQAVSSQQQAQQAIDEFNNLQAQVVENEKFPKGSYFQVNIATGEVKVTMPPPVANPPNPTPPAPASPSPEKK